MTKTRAKRKALEAAAANALALPAVLAGLDDDGLGHVLDALDAVQALGSLASATKQLSNLFRCRTPLELDIEDAEDAAVLLVSQAAGRPFLRCEGLTVTFADCALWSSVGGLLSAAGQWPELQRLMLDARDMDLSPGVSMDHLATGVLGVLPALQQLQRLTLHVPAFGACSAAVTGRATQLTRLELTVTQEPAADAAAADMTALSRLVRLQELVLPEFAPPMQPAAGLEGPFSLPSRLTRLVINAKGPRDGGDGREAVIGPWVTHLRGCPYLQELHLWYGAQEYTRGTDPSAVVQLLAQHTKQLRVLQMGVTVYGRATAHVREGWHAAAALAALTGLQHLSAEGLCISDQADWQALAQLTALTMLEGVKLCCAPEQQAGITLPRLQTLASCTAALSGGCLGVALLAFPSLRVAQLCVPTLSHLEPTQPPGTDLMPHPTLSSVSLEMRGGGPVDDAAAAEGATEAAASYWAGVQPVLSGVPNPAHH